MSFPEKPNAEEKLRLVLEGRNPEDSRLITKAYQAPGSLTDEESTRLYEIILIGNDKTVETIKKMEAVNPELKELRENLEKLSADFAQPSSSKGTKS